MQRTCVKAFCSSANLGSGFDVVAVALDAFYDIVEVIVESGEGNVTVSSVEGPYADSSMIINNTAKRAVEYALSILNIPVDVELKIWKGIPVSLGLGSSGASAAAAVKALVEALNINLSTNEQVVIAGMGEEISAGEPHYDNVAASLLGGLTVIYSQKPLKVAKFNIGGYFVVAVPLVKTPPNKTAYMREVIPVSVGLKAVVFNTSKLAALLTGFLNGNLKIAGMGMDDVIVEPFRSRYVPCYSEVKKAALKAGAYGVAISGAGPSIVALAGTKKEACNIARAVKCAYENRGLKVMVRIANPAPGASVM